jgi:site-specific DNA recombinase
MGKTLRCAIYTRKSSEEGLEQGFNSLDAQREASEAYVLSQAGEGWSALKTAYDDGGFSGGSMERPGLTALLADIARGRVDVVVVYKVDRLTRSLADFAKIVETFDRYGVSFVSVTQAFNTTTSMGRLTLNVLLSFAQFEREVTGERIRDKIAASKKKGMWMGGVPPLGYDLPTDLATRALVVNEAEAETVRLIFQRYLALGSVHAVMIWLDDQAIRSKARVTARGRAVGGLRFERGALFHLLKNRVYIGEITHKGQSFPGAHPAIVDPATFDAVQQRLSSQARQFHARPTRVSTMMLKGLLFDADGAPMSPTFGHGSRGQVYRYYVSAPLQQGRQRDPDDEAIRRVPAHAIESLVRGRLERLSAGRVAEVPSLVARVEVHATTVQMLVNRSAFFRRPSDPETELETLDRRLPAGERIIHDRDDEMLARITLPCCLKFGGGKVWITDPNGAVNLSNTAPDRTLIRALQSAHRLIAKSAAQRVGRPEDLAIGHLPKSPYERNLCRLAFLAPDIQAAILEGRQPYDLTLARFFHQDIPPVWADQRRAFGFPC